jgi:Zn-dependent protease with chaperone function
MRRGTDLVVLGTLAHELAHVEYQDPYEVPRAERIRDFLVVAALLVVSLVIAVTAGTLAFGVSRVFGASAELQAGLVVTAGLVAFFLAWIWLLLRWQRADLDKSTAAGRDRQLMELRADLRAVQLAGRRPVVAKLENTSTRRREFGQRLEAPLRRRYGSTHPSDAARLAAVLAYDPSEDPAIAADRVLHLFSDQHG